jgi:hypothetical protein
VAQVVELLPSKAEALSSDPTTAKTNKQTREITKILKKKKKLIFLLHSTLLKKLYAQYLKFLLNKYCTQSTF